MRRFLGVLVGASLLASCSDVSDSLVPETPGGVDSSVPGSSADIFDGSSGDPGANPHFFFLPPLVPQPETSGVVDASLEPVVTVDCLGPVGPVACPAIYPLVFSMDATDPDLQVGVSPGSGYSVHWKTSRHPAPATLVFRIGVSIFDQDLGWLEVKSYDQQDYNSYRNSGDPNGYVVISDNGTANIAFRIEDGALESAFCEEGEVEDCDVEIFSYDEEGCLRVFNEPGATGEILGSQACVPRFSAQMGGQQVDEFVVVMTLEEEEIFQGGEENSDWQIPFFPDIRTFPDGINFDGGVSVTICQVSDPAVLDDNLHQYLRPFLILANGSTVLPEEYYFEVGGECEGLMDGAPEVAAANQGGRSGLLRRLAGGFTRVSQFFLPEPLHARRRLHGGLNTVVWKISSDEGGGETDNVAGPSGVSGLTLSDPETTVLEMGAILDVDPSLTVVSPPPPTVVETEGIIEIEFFDFGGNPFPMEGTGILPIQLLPVTVTAELGSVEFLGFVNANTYSATYTAPATVGADSLTIEIDGVEVKKEDGSRYYVEVKPVAPSADDSFFEVSESEVDYPTTVTVTVLDQDLEFYVAGGSYDPNVQIDVFEVLVDGTAGASVLDAGPIQAVDLEFVDELPVYDGRYLGSWEPDSFGEFWVVVTMGEDPNKEEIGREKITTAPWPADPTQSSISVSENAVVESATTVTVNVGNTEGDPYYYGDVRGITVEVTVTGDGEEDLTFLATDEDLNGTYVGQYIPQNPGTHTITATIDDDPIPGSMTSEVAPLSGDLIVEVVITAEAPVLEAAPADGLPVELYLVTGQTLSLVESDVTGQDGTVTFGNKDFGEYVVHLPKRDFDALFTTEMTQTLTHDQAPNTVTFTATTLAIPATATVWRIRAGGNGNAYRYIPGGRSWTSAQNQVRDDVLHGVQGHLATATSLGENAFIAGFFASDPALCPNDTSTKKCRVRGWLGLTDEAVEGQFEWVTGEQTDWFSWPDGYTAADQPLDRKGNRDHVEIGPDGLWGIINGASSTNDGYFVEWGVEWPVTPQ